MKGPLTTVESWPALDLSTRKIEGRGALPAGTVIQWESGDGHHHHGKIDVDGVTVLPAKSADFKNLEPKDDFERRKEILKGNFALHVRRARDKHFGSIADRLAECLDAAKVAREYFTLTGESIAK